MKKPGEEFKCHKVILAGRSTVFDAMFTQDLMEKNENKVEVEDVDADNIKEMLVFIYSGKVLALNLWNSADKIDNKQRPKCPGPGGGEVTRHLYPRGGGGVARHQDCSVLGVFHPDRGRGDNLGHCQG